MHEREKKFIQITALTSVSGRGISDGGLTSKLMSWKSHSPMTYCRGSLGEKRTEAKVEKIKERKEKKRNQVRRNETHTRTQTNKQTNT